MQITEKLRAVQLKLKAPKNQKNNFGNYKYRSCEDILEALKPLLDEQKITLVIHDELLNIGERYYVKAVATLYDDGQENSISATAYAREEESKKGMDSAQITGSASSYARKYALNGLFNIDDTKDPDSHDNREHQPQPVNKTYVTEAQVKLMLARARDFSGLDDRKKIVEWFIDKVGIKPTEVRKDDVNQVLEVLEGSKDADSGNQ